MALSRPSLGPRTELPATASLGRSALTAPDGLGPKTNFSTPSLGEPDSQSTMSDASEAMRTATLDSLVLAGGSASYAIKSCTISYQVNAFPTASVLLALGYNVDDQVVAQFESEVNSATVWTIAISGNTGSNEYSGTLFTGHLQAVARQANKNPTGAQYSLQLVFSGVTASLARLAFAGHVFWNDKTKFLLNEGSELFFQSDGAVAQALMGGGERQAIVTDKTDIAPAVVAITDKLYTMLSGGTDTAHPTVAQYFQPADTINLQSAVAPVVAYQRSTYEELYAVMVGQLRTNMLASNVWAAFQQLVTGEMLCQIIPRQSGFTITPAFYWNKTSVATLTGADVLAVGGSMATTAVRADYDTVFVQRVQKDPTEAGKSLAAGYVIWPETAEYATAKAMVTSLPSWLQAALVNKYTRALSDPTKPTDKSKRLSVESWTPPTTEVSDDYARRYAQMVYATVKAATNSKTLTVPWYRFDLLQYLGYVIKVNGLATPDTLDDADTFYGAMMGLTFSATSGPQSANAGLTIDLGYIRNEEENNKFGLSEHPIYRISAIEDTTSVDSTGEAVDNSKKPTTPAMSDAVRKELASKQKAAPPGYYSPGVPDSPERKQAGVPPGYYSPGVPDVPEHHPVPYHY